MKRFLAYVVVLALSVPLLSGCGRPRIIPGDRMAKIYAEMFIADQWLHDHPSARRVADTTFFYEPIFNKYGYSFKDYAASVDKYINDPDKFAKIIRNTASIIEKRAKEVNELRDIENRILTANAAIFGYQNKDFTTDSSRWRISHVLWGTDTLALGDSICPLDSLALRDSLAFRDSLAVLDSTARADSLVLRDTVSKHIKQKEICNLQKNTDTPRQMMQ